LTTDDFGKISYANSRKMLDRAAEAREKIMAAAEQCEYYPKDILADWLRDDVMKGLRNKTNQLIYEFAEKHEMSLHHVCMHFMPKYGYKTEIFDAEGRCVPSFNVDISLEPMPLDLEQGPGYWKDKYFKLKEQIQKLVDDKDDGDGTVTLARGHHIRNADGTVTDVSNDPRYKTRRPDV
jgi:hypothetical protein